MGEQPGHVSAFRIDERNLQLVTFLILMMTSSIVCMIQCDWTAGGNLRDKLKTITPQLEDMRQRRIDRKNKFFKVLNQLQLISNEICSEDNMYKIIEVDTDLSERRLEELHSQLAYLQDEKVCCEIENSLCSLITLAEHYSYLSVFLYSPAEQPLEAGNESSQHCKHPVHRTRCGFQRDNL